MTVENKHRADNKTLREFYEATGSKGVLWIDDRTGRIVELPVESRIRRGEGGCQLCHEELDAIGQNTTRWMPRYDRFRCAGLVLRAARHLPAGAL